MATTENEECPTETEVITEDLPEASRSAGEEDGEAEQEEQAVVGGEMEASLQAETTEHSEVRPAVEEAEESLVTGRDEEIENYQSTVRELSAAVVAQGEELGAHYLAHVHETSFYLSVFLSATFLVPPSPASCFSLTASSPISGSQSLVSPRSLVWSRL